jgi:predicted nucleic acid-binding protein
MDTNVLVYWLVSDPIHSERAKAHIKNIEAGEKAVTSALSLVQIDWVMRELLRAGVIREYDSHKMVESVLGIQNLRIVGFSSVICKGALNHVSRYGLDLEDAIHLETALRRKCSEILSADADFDRGPLTRGSDFPKKLWHFRW